MSDNNPVTQEVQTFDKKCLKKTNTAEKNSLPTKEGEAAPAVIAEFVPGRSGLFLVVKWLFSVTFTFNPPPEWKTTKDEDAELTEVEEGDIEMKADAC
ncbi:thymosin beta 1 [Alosa pseudoharengus]|uniref:thymosin beta 1 n=1 Tax=Alosa pseudoharengus TaxID=34774 RepID=UPI003F8B1050